MKPYEIIAAPFEVYTAPVGEPFPLIDAAPAGNWALLGTSGNKNITEDGVTISHPQTIELLRFLGATQARKAVRTEEDLMISAVLADITLEQYSKALNGNTVTDNAEGSGVAGFREVNLLRGLSVTTYALLVRGPSPYNDSLNLQYEVRKVVHTGEPEVVYSKGEAAGVLMEFMAVEDTDAAAGLEFGRIVASDAAALP